jgi:tripartite-type tricarboxylate transporter receptor subunit TctC
MTMKSRPSRTRAGALWTGFLLAPLVLTACGGGEAEEAEALGAEGAGGAAACTFERDVEWIVPYSPGGGFDTYSRGIAEVMQQEGFLPGDPNVVIRNVTPLPQGITQMYTADADGYTVGILPMPAAIAQQIQDPEVARWKTEEFTVLGQVDENAYVVYVPADSPYQTIEDLIAASDLNTVTVEQGSSSALAGQAAIEALDLDATVTYGAEGSSEVVTAALRGDADFFVYGSTDVVGFVDSGDVRPILFLGTEDQRPEALPWLQDVPSAADIGFPDLAGTVTELRVIVAPPDVPADMTECLRTALSETMASQAFIDWAVEAERPIVPRDAEEATANVTAQIEQMEILVPELSS